MSKTATYSKIASYTVTGSATDIITFSSVPQGYTDLVMVANWKEFTNQQGYVRFNSDSGGNYSRVAVYGAGSSAASFRQANISGVNVGMGDGGTGVFQADTLHIMDYSNTTTQKTVLNRWSNNTSSAGIQAIGWRSTAAISTITVLSFDGSSSIAIGSNITIYGIEAAK